MFARPGRGTDTPLLGELPEQMVFEYAKMEVF